MKLLLQLATPRDISVTFIQCPNRCQFSAQQGLEVCVWWVQDGDAYAFGVMLYELYSGQPAWAGISTGDIISAKLRTHASQALRMSADAPPALQVPKLSPTLVSAWSCSSSSLGFCSITLQGAVVFCSPSASLAVLCNHSSLLFAAFP